MNRRTLIALLVWAVLSGGLAANAQPVTTLYSFVRGPINPHAGLTLGPDGNFYGTTAAGGKNLGGTVYRMATNGVLTTLFQFSSYPSGSGPTADLTLGPDGNFYGTTMAGGTTLSGVNDTGVVFKMNTNGIPTTLVNFNGTNGGHPDAAVTLGPDGYYYGTTEFSGSNNVGTVFKVTTNGTLTTLVTFNNTNGANPVSCLTLAPGGIFYGTTKLGGKFGLGTAFKLTTNGDFTMLNSFDQTNGAWPAGRMALGSDGNLYGTTAYIGTAFEMTTNGAVTTLVNFNLLSTLSLSTTNGEFPYSGLTPGPDGCYYGTTSQGGANGSGTIFKVSTNGTAAFLATMPGVQVEFLTNFEGVVFYSTNNFATSAVFVNGVLTTLYNFTALANSDNGDGADPESDLTVGPDGNLYGTTVGGGTNGAGAVFKINTNGTFTALASFAGDTGYNPEAGVTAGPGGSLYGVVKSGGTTGYGTAYKVSAAGQFTLLHNFSYFPDGANPQATLIQGPDGNFYGTAAGGGTNLLQTGPNSYQAESFGTVFELATNGAFTTLACFNGANGANPYGGLAFGLDGNFYGTTAYGGISNNGVVFRLLTNGTMTALTNFTGPNGANPYGGLSLGLDGNFYGTCEAGGSNGNGTVFQVTTNGALTTLFYFDGTNGANPNAGLTLGQDGSFYGTSYGANFGHRGTVFKITTSGTLTTLVNFAQTNGSGPVGGLALGPDGNIYGTTSLGGVNNFQGTLFKITTDGTLTILNSFAIPNGSFPFATLTLQTNSHFINFYGTTLGDGGDHPGTVFRVNLTTSYALAENTTKTLSPLTNDMVWTTGGVLGLLTAVPTNGTAQISGSGIVFTPTTNFTGTSTISYTVTDNAGGTNASFITILVTNIPPVANPDFYSVAENSSANVLSPLANDVPGTSGGLLGLVRVSPTNGTAVISGTNVLFTPSLNFLGTATIGYTITDNVGGTNSSLITVTVVSPFADLNLSADAAPEPVAAGSNLVYSIMVTNQGPSAATGVVVSNQVPASVNFVSATGGGTPSGGILLVDLDSLAANATTNVQVTVQPTSAGKLTNLFQVFANETDPVLTNNSATVVSTVTNASPPPVQADLIIGGTNSAVATFTDGLVYSLYITNLGPGTATGVVVSNQIPANILFVSATDGATPTNGVLLLNLGSLVSGEVTNVTINMTPTNYTVGPFTNVFQVFANETDPVPANNSAAFITQLVLPTTDFTSSTAEVDTTNATTVSLQTTNYSTELIAKLPNGTVVYDQTFSAPLSDPTVQSAITTAAGDLSGAGASSYSGPTQTSFSQTTNNSSVTIPGGTNIDIIVGTKQWVGPVTIKVGNFGVVQGYTFDAIQTNYALPIGGHPSLLTLPPGDTDFDTMILALFDFLPITTNTATYLDTSVYTMTGIVAQADLELTALATPEPVGVSNNLIYTLTITNRGPNAASSVVVSNQIPAGVTFISATGGSTPSSGVLLVNLSSLAANATTNAQITVQPTAAGSLTNTFQVFANELDPVLTNNSTTVISTVTNAEILSITSTVSTRTIETNLTSTANQRSTNYSTRLFAVMPGGSVLFDQTFSVPFTDASVQSAITTAAGNLTTAGATSYTGPTQTTFSQILASNSLVTVTNQIGTNIFVVTTPYVGPQTIFVGTNQTTPLVIAPGATDFDTLTTFDVTNLLATTTTSNFLNSSVYAMTGIVAQADMKLTALATPEPVGISNNLVYTLIITNRGPNAASGVVVSNRVPANVTFVSATGGNTPSGGILLIGLGSLAANRTTNAQVTIQPDSVGKLTNLFTVFANESDPVLTNNPATVISTVTNVPPPPPPPVDLALSIVAAPNPVNTGDPLTYSLTLTNQSSTTATSVVVSNTLPAGVTLDSALPSQGTVTTNGNILRFAAGSLANGAAATFAIVVTPNAAGSLTNSAIAGSTETDSQYTNNVTRSITSAVPGPGVTNLVLTVLSGVTLNPQTGLFEAHIQVYNGGPDTPSSVLVLVHGVPANATLYNASGVTNGVPYVQSVSPLPVSSNVVFVLEIYVPTRVKPSNLTYTVQAGPPVILPIPTGTPFSVDSVRTLGDGSMLVEFTAVVGHTYAIQYSSDMNTWRTAVPAIKAPSNRVQWIDAGPPKTDSPPQSQTARYYRVVLIN